MATGDAFYAKARKKIEHRIGEPVEVLGWASRSGAMSAVIATTVVRGAETAMDAPVVTGGTGPKSRMGGAGGEKAAKLPMNFMVVLAPTAFRVLKIRRGWSGLTIKGELGALPREGLQLDVTDGGMTKQIRLDGADGSAVGFEMTLSKFATKFADDLSAALS
jgi:hypothetical protein